MRLMSVTLERYKRFEERTVIDVAGDVVALVGPNEAGKSTILDALLALDDKDDITRREKTRDADGITRIRAGYVLDEADRAALADIPGGGEVRWWTLEKWAQGDESGRYFALHPVPKRDLRPRHQLAAALQGFAEEEELVPRFGSVGNVVIGDIYPRVLAALSSADDTLSEAQIEEVRLFAGTMFAFGDICAEPEPDSTNQYVSPAFCALLRQLQEYNEGVSPHTQAGRILVSRRPTSVMFTEEDRDLRSTYELSKVANSPPPALENVLRLAGLDVRALARAIDEGDSGRRVTLLDRANTTLRDIFQSTWKQADLTVMLALHETVLEILVSIPGGGYNEMHERSAGLRTFVALRAFLAGKDIDTPPILLVDEAEQHLHYDAQADLIDLFTEQHLAAKVIYSTHSAGCLPRDLGNGIRVVIPTLGRERSRVENSVWSGGKAGFTPLIYGMGATTFAFLPARFVVLGEGPSDAMLYPTLFREALELRNLDFQVAPGLASVPPVGMASLTGEGGQVVFLTDGDKDGERYRKTLAAQGVGAAQLIGLDAEFPASTQLEDLVDPALYVDVVNDLLRDFQRAQVSLRPEALPVAGRVEALKAWCRQHGFNPPEKTDVAQRLLDRKASAALEGEQIQLLAESHTGGMVRLHARIGRVFSPEPEPTIRPRTRRNAQMGGSS
jgi:predicted ATP-dependent endonuclease of OLD family